MRKLFFKTAGAVFLLLLVTITHCQRQNDTSSEILLEFDESDIRNLNLNVKWRFQPGTKQSSKQPTRFVLLMEIKRLNFSTFLFDYSSPQLIDDETIVKASLMEPEHFKHRVELSYLSAIDCSLNCINSSKHVREQVFDCNIFYYEPTTKTCVLYQYDYNSSSINNSSTAMSQEHSQSLATRKPNRNLFEQDEIYESFKDECDMDEILGDVIGYSKLCRRILEFKETHTVKINPYIDYRFSISIRDENNTWTPFLRKEYQYTPKINIELRGDLKLGSNISLECLTELSPSIVDSITWKNNNPAMKGLLSIAPLTVSSLHQTYFCEIRFNYFRMIQKAYKLNLTSLGNLRPSLALSYVADVANLNVQMSWNVSAPVGSPFTPEKLILLYSEGGEPYKLVNKYLLFELSKYDNVPLRGARDFEEIVAGNEDECALSCLQRSFCDHFVFIKSIEPFKNAKRKNCQLAANTNNNFFPCRYDLTCANLSPYERHIQNNSLSVLILPNITYTFKLQLKDKHLNWTDFEETAPIHLPLKMTVKQVNSAANANVNPQLVCITNVNKSVQQKISWFKDNKELELEPEAAPTTPVFSQTSNATSPYANSVLEINWRQNRTYQFAGVYTCRIHIRYPEVGEGKFYTSEALFFEFKFHDPLVYTSISRNLTLPTIPGLILEIPCQVWGSPIRSLQWLIDGLNYNDKKQVQIANEPFVVTLEDRNSSMVNNLLVLRIDNAKPPSKYECILNENVTVRSHFIEIVEQKPQFDIRMDTSNLNKLQVSIQMNQRADKSFNRLFSNLSLSTKPLKFAILYVENATFDTAYQTYIAPETLSKSDPKQRTSANDEASSRILLGNLKSTQHAIQSCKVLCFNTPFCTSYEYLMYDDSCKLFSNARTNSYYKGLIQTLNRTLAFTDFNLMHLLELDFVRLLQEENTFNSTMLTDNKIYLSCEPRTSATTLNEELHCSDELAEFVNKYVFDGLKPLTSYQFRVEVVNAFGKSSTYYTPQIDVPFPINPIMEKYSRQRSSGGGGGGGGGGGQGDMYSLECSTPLVSTRNLRFAWYKNGVLIAANETSLFEQVQREPDATRVFFSSELIFRQEARRMHGIYTCSLSFIDDFLHLEKNVSYVFISRMNPSFTLYNDSVNKVDEGDDWAESCVVEAWPLPSVQWFFNNKPVSNKSSNVLPYAKSHHTNMTTITTNLLIPYMIKSVVGRYVCMLNGVTPIRNVTVILSDNVPINRSDKSDQIAQINDETSPLSNGKSSGGLGILMAIFLIAIACMGLFSAFVYYKKKKIKLSTPLSYNRLDEESVATGVDNFNLTEDT